MSEETDVICLGERNPNKGQETAAANTAPFAASSRDVRDDEIICLGGSLRGVSLATSVPNKIDKGKRRAVDMDSKPSLSLVQNGPSEIRHKRIKIENQARQQNDADLHHRDTFAPPPGTPFEYDLEHELSNSIGPIVLDDFVLYRPSKDDSSGRGPTCSLGIFDYDRSAHGDRGEIKRSRDALVDSAVMYGKVRGGSLRSISVLLSGLVTYRVVSTDDFRCSILLITSIHQYILNQPAERYVDLFHAFWVLHQGAAAICRAVLTSPGISASRFLAKMKREWEGRQGGCSTKSKQTRSHLIPDVLFIDELARIRSTFSLYSKEILQTATGQSVELSLGKIKSSILFRELDTLARLTRRDRRSRLGVIEECNTERENTPVMTVTMELSKRKTLKKYEFKEEKFKIEEYVEVDVDEGDVSGASEGRLKWLSKAGSQNTEIKNKSGEVERQWDGVRLNGVEYWLGDVVEIRTGLNKQARAMIRYLKRISLPGALPKHVVHVHWMRPLPIGTQDELFVEDCACDTIAVRHILSKVDCAIITSEMSVAAQPGRAFCRFVAQQDVRVRQLPESYDRTNTCDSCCRKTEIESMKTVTMKAKHCFTHLGVTYHLDDFVYIDSGIPGVAHSIGHIQDILRDATRVRLLRRYAELQCNGEDFVDQERLYATDEFQIVSMSSMRGKCFVYGCSTSLRGAALLSYYCDTRTKGGKANTKTDLVPLRQTLHQCQGCLDACRDVQRSYDRFDDLEQMPFADFYSGGGGGVLSASKYFDVRVAVEMNPVACDTLERNHPNLDVFCSTVDILHDNTLRHEAGETTFSVYDPRDAVLPPSRRKRLGLLPARGTMVGYMAGIPCQGHSRTNRFQDPNDPRNEELFKMMSEIDRACPDFVILENVAGFKDVRDDGSFIDPKATTSWAHLAIQLLLKLDYQVQMAILDSRSYGSPQNRSRLWMVAARRGVPLPNLPDATHANPHMKLTMFSLDSTEPVGFYVDSTHQTTPGSGIHPAVTIRDAISDLPDFEYSPPHMLSRTKGSKIPAFNCARMAAGANTKVGFDRPVAYKSLALTSYQAVQRAGSEQLKDHLTPSRSAAELQMVYSAFTESDLPGNARRMDPTGGFFTLLTNSVPGGKTTEPIHYSQRRTRSIAESKRAMGFPDSYELAGTAVEMDAQLGNAWVVQMGQAIIRSIRDVIREEWMAAGEPEDLFEWWRDSHPVPPRIQAEHGIGHRRVE